MADEATNPYSCPICKGAQTSEVSSGMFFESFEEIVGDRICQSCGAKWRPPCTKSNAEGLIPQVIYYTGLGVLLILMVGKEYIGKISGFSTPIMLCLSAMAIVGLIAGVLMIRKGMRVLDYAWRIIRTGDSELLILAKGNSSSTPTEKASLGPPPTPHNDMPETKV